MSDLEFFIMLQNSGHFIITNFLSYLYLSFAGSHRQHSLNLRGQGVEAFFVSLLLLVKGCVLCENRGDYHQSYRYDLENALLYPGAGRRRWGGAFVPCQGYGAWKLLGSKRTSP